MAERSRTTRPRSGSTTRASRSRPAPPSTRLPASVRHATDLGILERYMRGLDEEGPSAGLRVRDPYTQLLTIFRGVNIVATAFARVPFEIWDIERDEPITGSEAVESRRRLFRLTQRPNPAMTWRKLVETAVLHYHSGNAYLYPFATDVFGVPQELRLLQPRRMRPFREPGDDVMTLRGWEYQATGNRGAVILPVDKVLRLEYAVNEADPFVGIGPFGPGRVATDAEYLAGTYQRATLQNGGAPGQILSFDGEEDELPREQADKLESEWMQKFGAAGGGNKIALLTGRWTYQVLGFRPRDMEFLSQRRFSLEEFARLLNIPPLYLGVYENSGLSDAGLRVQQRLLYENNIIPLAVKLAELLNEFIIKPIDSRLEGVFNFDHVEALRDDLSTKASVAVQFVSAGWSREQVDERLDLGFDYSAERLAADAQAQAQADGDQLAGARQPLSGVQLTAIMDVVKAVVAGELPRDSAIGILVAGMAMTPEEAEAVIGSAGTGTVLKANPADVPAQPAVEAKPEPVPSPPPGAEPAQGDAQAEPPVPPQGEKRALRVAGRAARAARKLTASQRRKAQRRALKASQAAEHAIENKARSVIMGWRAGVLRRLVRLNASRGGAGARAVLRAAGDDDLLALTPEDIATVLGEIDERALRRAITPGIRQAYRAGTATLDDVMEAIGVPVEDLTAYQRERLPQLVDGYIDARLGTGLPTRVTDDTRRAVNEVIVNAMEQGLNLRDTIEGIRGTFDASVSRARTIARTETATAMSSSRQAAYREQGVEKHQWMTAGDEHVRDTHAALDGVIAEVDEEFTTGLRFPGDPDGPPEEIINCRCTTVPLSRAAYEREREDGAQTASELALEDALAAGEE